MKQIGLRVVWVLTLGLLLVGLASGRDVVARPASPQASWTDVVQVTNETGEYWNSPRTSGDGEWIAFRNSPYLYISRSDGTSVQSFASTAYWSDISADGGKVVGTSGGALHLYSGGVEQSITPCVSGGGGQRCLYAAREAVAISGDGRWVFFISDDAWPCEYVDDAWQCSGNQDGSREVWRLDLSTDGVTQVTNFSTGADTGPWWVSTDFSGSKVAFTAGTDDEVHVYSANGDGSDLRQLAEARPGVPSYRHCNVTFVSGDGAWIVFTGKDAGGHSEVAIVRSDGSERRLIRSGYGCDHGSYGSDCSISYDGSLLAVGTLVRTTEILDNHGTLLETISGEELDLAYDGLHVTFLSTRSALGLGSETDEQVFAMKRGVTKQAPLKAEIGSRMTYTVTLRHGETSGLAGGFIDPLPAYTTFVTGSLQTSTGTATYSAAQNQITWNETIDPGETVTITFAVTPTCTAAPPPPERVLNRITATLGTETLHPMAITALTLPEKDLAALADAPVDGATGVLIEAGGTGLLLRWHDRTAGMTCGSTASADVAYRVYVRQQGGAWQEVGSFPNCSRQVQLSPDALSCRDNGDPATHEWKVEALDPRFPCREAGESTFGFTTASCRPEIEVEPEFRLTPGYFLDNESLVNRIKVTVDWNGPAYETPESSAPYGKVYFELNGAQVQEEGLQWGAEHAYDMGADWNAELSCANNTLNIWATHPADGGGEVASLKTTLQPTVFPFPGWVEWAITHIPGSDASFETQAKAPLVEYSYGFKYPEPPFEATWSPPAWVPYLGGRALGIQETQAEANATAKSDGAGSAGVTGKTGLDLGAFTSEGTLWGKGDARFVCGESLAFERAEMGFAINATVEQKAGLADVIPAVKAAEKWPVVGRIVRWVNSIATLKAAFTPGVEITTEFIEQNDQLVYDTGQGTGSIDGKAMLATEVCEGLSAEAYGGGTPYVTIQVPKNPDYLKEVGIDMYYGATFQAWSFEEAYERKVNCHYPGGCSEVEAEAMAAMAAGMEPGWHLIPRDYDGPDYGVVAAPLPAGFREYALQATAASDEETVLIPNAYVRSEPALAVRDDGVHLLAYVHDDVSDPQGRGTEIRALTWNGSWSSVPITLTGDVQPDYAPAVAFDRSGNGIVVWERSTLATSITPSLNIPFAQSLEIAARTWLSDTTLWGPAITLTQNALMDRAPRLSAGGGAVIALWETTDGTDALGTADHPLTYTYALWNGTDWGEPSAALAGLTDVLDVGLAVYSPTQAALVYVRDMDGVISTTTDAELYYSLFDGITWSGPIRLTDDSVADVSPSLVYDGDGSLYLLWLRDGNLVSLIDSWAIADRETVRQAGTGGGVLGFTLNRSPGGHLALIWQAMGESGANLAYTIRDTGAGLWGTDQTLMDDADVETAHSPAFGNDGTLYLAYQQVETDFFTRTFELSPTHSFTVTHLPEPGDSRLVFRKHTVGRDLAFDRLAITPANPAAGDTITLTATLRNAADLAVVAPEVAFYDGASGIITKTLPITLAAGYTATVPITWTVPIPAVAHTLRAVADPGGDVVETDETNNEASLKATLPDLTIAVLYTTNAHDVVTATARLSNTGVLAAGAPFTVALRAADPVTGSLLGVIPVTDDLPAGAAVAVTLALTDPSSLVGLGETLWAVVDEADSVDEINEQNNDTYARLALLPDLTLTAHDIQGGDPVTVTLRNSGPVTASNVALTVRWDGPEGTMVHSTTVSALAPGATRAVTFTVSGSGDELWACVDPGQSIAESNEGNNLAVRGVEAGSRWPVYLPLVLRAYP